MTAKATGMDWIASDHNLGRTLFATEAVNAGVDPAVREFDLMHKTDQFGGTYVQFHKTAEGEELIRRELLKLRPVLNVKSDKGAEQPKESYFEQTIETLAISKGMDPNEVIGRVYSTRTIIGNESGLGCNLLGHRDPGLG